MNSDIDLNHSQQYRIVRDSSVRGAGAGVASVILQFAIRGFSTIALARLLVPEDFGLVAIAGIALNFFSRIADMGLTTAATQKHRIELGELTTLFWVNSVGGLLLCVLMIGTAPLMGALFSDTRVEHIVVAMSLGLVVTGIGAQHESLLRRNLQYGRLAAIVPIAQAAGTAIGLAAAIVGFGYWSIVAMHVVSRAGATIGYLLGARWKPGKPHNLRSVGSVLRFGGHISGSQILVYITHNLDSLIVGLVGGAVDLGLYRRGFNLLQLPIEHLKAHMDRLIPSSLSRLQRADREFSSLYRHGVSGLVFLGCPAIGLAFAEADALILAILGDPWMSAAPYLRWLAPAALASLLEVVVVWYLVPVADGRRLLIVRFIRVVFVAMGMLIGIRYGPIGVAAGYGIGSLVGLVFEFIYTVVCGQDFVLASLSVVWQPVISAALAATIVMSIPDSRQISRLLFGLVLYIVAYLGLFFCLPGGRGILRLGRMALATLLFPSRDRGV